MAGGYRIAAKPEMKDGRLVAVEFTAESTNDHREWYTRNFGQFAVVFCRVMPRQVAQVMAGALERGDAVELPGRYSEEEFDREFSFEWSPVHFLRPPVFADRGQY